MYQAASVGQTLKAKVTRRSIKQIKWTSQSLHCLNRMKEQLPKSLFEIIIKVVILTGVILTGVILTGVIVVPRTMNKHVEENPTRTPITETTLIQSICGSYVTQ